MPGFGFGPSKRAKRRPLVEILPLNALTLSANSVSEGAAPGTVVADILGKTTGGVVTLTNDASGRFALNGSGQLIAGLVNFDYETATSHNVTLRETKAGAPNSPRDTTIAVAVTNVLEVSLNALTLSGSTMAENSVAGTVVGAIQNKTTGATTTLHDDAGGRFALSGNNIVAGSVSTDYETATSHNITLRETHSDGSNSPRDSVITITITDVNEVVPGAAATTFATTPTIHYHPNSQSATLSGANLVQSCPDLSGLAALSGILTGGSTDVGPEQRTDALGRKFWRFSPGQYLMVSNALTAINSRQCVIMAVWRQHRTPRGMDQPLFSTRYSAYTNDSTNTSRTNGYILRTYSAAGGGQYTVPRLHTGTVDSFNGTPNGPKMIPGCQIHVAGVNSQTTANGGSLFYMNTDSRSAAQSSLSGTADVGGIIGGKSTSSNGVIGTSDTWFDLYEFALWKGVFTSTQSDAFAAAMVANYSIPTIDSQLILVGDSIMNGYAGAGTTVSTADTVGMQLCKPGAELVPTSMRVLNIAVSGSGVASDFTGVALINQRDSSAGGLQYVFSGGPSKNLIACMIGINDMRTAVGNLDAAAHYANVVALLNTTTTGYLQRGFKVTFIPPTAIGTSDTDQGRILAFRDLVVDPNTDVPVSQFLTDVLANTGQTFEGLVNVLPVHKITSGASGTVFQTKADAQDTGNYSTDTVHHQGSAMRLMPTGGDTPQYGIGTIA